jgi:[FeFe] hydrogenase H-cluster radical SAM maturase HydE
LYCGIRGGNTNAERYRLSEEEILSCASEGYELGFRTFVLQGGEDPYFTDEVLCGIVTKLKADHPDCAVTLSMGERSRESYQALFDAGADRYLLRHETADPEHYAKLHPAEMSFENRMRCLYDLKDIGYQVGCGFMVGSPYQTPETLAKDLKFIEEFKPDIDTGYIQMSDRGFIEQAIESDPMQLIDYVMINNENTEAGVIEVEFDDMTFVGNENARLTLVDIFGREYSVEMHRPSAINDRG